MAQVSRSSALRTWISERASRRRDGNAVGALSVVMDVGHLSFDGCVSISISNYGSENVFVKQ